MAYQMDLKKYKWKEAEQKLQLLTQQYDSLYSKEHPNYTLLELQKQTFINITIPSIILLRKVIPTFLNPTNFYNGESLDRK